MTRALRFFALLSALFVVAMRFSSVLPLAIACTGALPEAGAVPACSESDAPSSEDDLALVGFDNDADDNVELLAPASVKIELQGFATTATSQRGALALERARPSHRSGLERPPRA